MNIFENKINSKDAEKQEIFESRLKIAREDLATEINNIIKSYDKNFSEDEEEKKEEQASLIEYIEQVKNDKKIYEKIKDIPLCSHIISEINEIGKNMKFDFDQKDSELIDLYKKIQIAGEDFQIKALGEEYNIEEGTFREFQVVAEKIRSIYYSYSYLGVLPGDKNERLNYLTRILAGNIIETYKFSEIEVPKKLELLAGPEKNRDYESGDDSDQGFDFISKQIKKTKEDEFDELIQDGVDPKIAEKIKENSENEAEEKAKEVLNQKQDLNSTLTRSTHISDKK